MLPLPSHLTHEVAAPAVLALSTMLARESDEQVVLDAGELVQFDSSALAVILACRRQVLAAGKTFLVKNLPDGLRRLADMYGVEALIPAD